MVVEMELARERALTHIGRSSKNSVVVEMELARERALTHIRASVQWFPEYGRNGASPRKGTNTHPSSWTVLIKCRTGEEDQIDFLEQQPPQRKVSALRGGIGEMLLRQNYGYDSIGYLIECENYRMRFDHVDEALVKYLLAGELLHAGKNSSFSFGRYTFS